MEYIKANLWEIRNSYSLRFLGIVLSIAQGLLLYSWWHKAPLFLGQNPVCWNFLPHCQDFIIAKSVNSHFLLVAYVGLIIISLICFATNRILGLAATSLFFATFINLSLVFLDSNLNNNLNSFVILISLFYLLIPQKQRSSKLLIISSYMVWGLLKINNEWLAGYWLSKNLDTYIPPKGIEWIAAISLFAEIVAPLFLLSKQAQRFFTGIGLLFVYNGLKGYIEGWESSVIHMLFLLHFIIAYVEEEKEAREAIYRSYLRPEPSKMWVVMVALLFWAFQIIPQGFFPIAKAKELPLQYIKNPIPIECKYHTLIRYQGGSLHHDSETLNNLSEKMKCNNLVYFYHAKKLCTQFADQPGFVGVSAYFLKRVVSQKEFTRVFESENICNQQSFAGGI